MCVFCGSSTGARPSYREAALTLGSELARRGIGLVYGGGKNGLMGVLAEACLAGGGEVIGVMPEALVNQERAHGGLTELIITGSMHERKARMAGLADAFIALPGGLGTFEELLEVTTWTQLGLQSKACALLNVEGYFAGLFAQADRAVAEGFLSAEHRGLLRAGTSVPEVLELVRVPVGALRAK
ncbi:MAG: TIGR00730 family Rossman fold protein [Bryobacteraceae bacterium]|nr:TIGR00730 family Rossman fold protein [Bryobacteraceae bacterium]